MNNFRIGDFVKLRDINNHTRKPRINKDNVFKITDILPAFVLLNNVEGEVPITDIEPIRINSGDDTAIYYVSYVAAGYADASGEVPTFQSNEDYYWDHFEKCFEADGKTLQQVIIDMGIEYVHQIQHYFAESGDGLIEKLRFEDY